MESQDKSHEIGDSKIDQGNHTVLEFTPPQTQTPLGTSTSSLGMCASPTNKSTDTETLSARDRKLVFDPLLKLSHWGRGWGLNLREYTCFRPASLRGAVYL